MSDSLDFDELLRHISYTALLRSIDPEKVAENLRACMADIKVDVEHLDYHVTPNVTVRQLQEQPNFEKDREVVSDILSSYLSDAMIDAMRHSGMDPAEAPVELLLASAFVLDPIHEAALKLLVPLH